jgi:hypothetical protein
MGMCCAPSGDSADGDAAHCCQGQAQNGVCCTPDGEVPPAPMGGMASPSLCCGGQSNGNKCG